MELKTFYYHKNTGWSVPTLPKLTSSHQMVLAFGAPGLIDHPTALQELFAAYPGAACIGCSTSGEIFNRTVQDDSLSVAVVGFATTALKASHIAVNAMEDSFEAGKTLAQTLHQEENGQTLRGVLVLSDGLNVNGSELVRGINSALSEDVIVTGGLAGDGAQFQRTWIWKDGVPVSGYVSAIGLYGDDISIGHGSHGGWDKFGPERRVTSSKNNVLYTLDDKPALALYKEYLGDRASELPASGLLFPLALISESTEKMLVRTILAVDEEAQSLTFAGDIPEGSKVRLMKANLDRLVQGAEDAANMIKKEEGDSPTLAVAISCVGRRLVLGERTEDEIEASLEALPPGTQQVGFYSYGEISPYSTKGMADLHNQTMTMTTFRELSRTANSKA